MPPQRQPIRKRFRSLSSDKTANPRVEFAGFHYGGNTAAERGRGCLMLAVRCLGDSMHRPGSPLTLIFILNFPQLWAFIVFSSVFRIIIERKGGDPKMDR